MTVYNNTFTQLINTAYPVAGQDNDSQGFRDNFLNIQQAVTTADNQLGYLTAYTAQTNSSSTNFQQNIIQNPTLQGYGLFNGNQSYNVSLPTTAPATGTNAVISLDFTQGNYWKIAVNTTATISVAWPTNLTGYNFRQEVILELTRDANTTLSTVPVSFNNVLVDSSQGITTNGTKTYTVNLTQAANPSLYSIQTVDGGVTQLFRILGGPFV